MLRACDPRTETLLWASESRGGTNAAVFVHAATFDGRFPREIPFAEKYDHRIGQGAGGELTQGIFSSAGFESRTLAPVGDALFMAPEDTLVQDGKPAIAGNSTDHPL
ncbi:MAG: esterase-like activity of phytase family protein [Rhodobacteraceae bacterium]|nr:esterase-like activity of phytase family protein [Paracoccaceae bacterium]